MASFELHGRSYSGSDTMVTPVLSRMSTRTTFSRSSPSQELPRLGVKSYDMMSVASCPTIGGPTRNATRRQVMSADSAPMFERQCTGFHSSHHADIFYSNDRPHTRREFKPAKATVPKKGLIKLTALDYELKNPEIFRQKTSVVTSHTTGAISGKSPGKHKAVSKKNLSRQLGIVKDNPHNSDIPTMWGAIQRECTTVGDFKKSILEFTGEHAPERPILQSYHTTVGSWDPGSSVYVPGKASGENGEENS